MKFLKPAIYAIGMTILTSCVPTRPLHKSIETHTPTFNTTHTPTSNTKHNTGWKNNPASQQKQALELTQWANINKQFHSKPNIETQNKINSLINQYEQDLYQKFTKLKLPLNLWNTHRTILISHQIKDTTQIMTFGKQLSKTVRLVFTVKHPNNKITTSIEQYNKPIQRWESVSIPKALGR